MIASFAQDLLTWYFKNGRSMPWRGSNDPYLIWVSEIMLQQTRVETVIPYFQAWMKQFPTIGDLASASEQQVLQLWEGLGYYSRARNLHKTAQIIINDFDSHIPQERNILEKLPGIGSYTAGAITSIAFNMDETALDGNIRRVYARIFNVQVLVTSPEGKKQLQTLTEEHLPTGQAGDFNQALMDLGATICTPRGPDCSNCPVKKHCLAFAQGLQHELPILKKRAAVPHHTVTAAILRQNKKLLITQRPAKGLLGSLWEFPGGKVEPGESLADCLRREIQEELGVNIQVNAHFGKYLHAYTHFRVTLHAFFCELKDCQEPRAIIHDDLKWVSHAELENFPMGKIDRQISLDLMETIKIDREDQDAT
ncbi:MAG: A/G-specific adenine glycosylase [Anaerolineaceae bacterium]|nr:A/G-specific adenine glycosylase [Anaerolineaceae bacterium]